MFNTNDTQVFISIIFKIAGMAIKYLLFFLVTAVMTKPLRNVICPTSVLQKPRVEPQLSHFLSILEAMWPKIYKRPPHPPKEIIFGERSHYKGTYWAWNWSLLRMSAHCWPKKKSFHLCRVETCIRVRVGLHLVKDSSTANQRWEEWVTHAQVTSESQPHY